MSAPVPVQIGLTGNVASGKSTVGRLWEAAGVPRIDADELSRRAVAPGSAGLERVVEWFGAEMLREDGSLDRDRLRGRVFDDDEARRELEGILHPIIARLREDEVRELAEQGTELILNEIPLLFEAGLEGTMDRVVVVHAAETERLRRMVEDRAMDPAGARRMIASQGDPDEKRRKADDVLDNDGTREALESAALALLDRIRREEVGTMRLDLHLHTWGSWDSLSDPEAVLERALARGVERIAITDHNRIHVALEMAARHPDHVIAGEEVKVAEGIDVIGLHLKDEIPKGTPAEECCRKIREQDGIVYLPHPYAAGKGGGGRYAEQLAPSAEVIEAFNARLRSSGANRRGGELAARFGLPVGAGSDAHTVAEVGNGRIEVARHPNTVEALRSVLPFGAIEGERAPLHVFAASNWAKVRKKLGWRPPEARSGS
ncbi:MAG: dephospho-CoA kinase [Gemmatimonadales bacterium]|nr:MAG: dephospho-CoA kinase [Gemmatimonadales bacterium]